MAYEETEVQVEKSQKQIRALMKLVGGSAIAFISQTDPHREGFEVIVNLPEFDGAQNSTAQFRIRIVAEIPKVTGRTRDPEQRIRRIWRVLFHHFKTLIEAEKTGVLEFREIFLPYIVTGDGRTVADHVLPQLRAAMEKGGKSLLLPARGESGR